MFIDSWFTLFLVKTIHERTNDSSDIIMQTFDSVVTCKTCYPNWWSSLLHFYFSAQTSTSVRQVATSIDSNFWTRVVFVCFPNREQYGLTAWKDGTCQGVSAVKASSSSAVKLLPRTCTDTWRPKSELQHAAADGAVKNAEYWRCKKQSNDPPGSMGIQSRTRLWLCASHMCWICNILSDVVSDYDGTTTARGATM